MAELPEVVLDYGDTVVVKSKTPDVAPLEYHANDDENRVRVTAPPKPVEPEPPAEHLLGVDISKLPTSGSAWSHLLSWADRTTMPDLRDQDNQGDIVTLAQALVGVRTGDVKYLTGCRGRLERVRTTAGPGVTTGDTLGMVRGMGAIAIAATLVDYREPAFAKWVRDMLTWQNPDRQYTIRSTQEKRPNNWGTHSGAARVAMARYLEDEAELAQAAKVFRGYLGDRTAYAQFVYGDDLSWQVDSLRPVGVNPRGATKQGVNIDGVMPDDMRRGGKFPTVGAAGKSYTWEGLQGVMLAAILLKAAGLDVIEWQDRAIQRAYATAVRLAGGPSGDDTWQPYAMHYLYGTAVSEPKGVTPGKGFIGAEWLYGSGG